MEYEYFEVKGAEVASNYRKAGTTRPVTLKNMFAYVVQYTYANVKREYRELQQSLCDKLKFI